MSKQEKPAAAKKKKLSFKEQQELNKLPQMIDELEAKQTALTQQISSPAFYKKDPLAIAKTLDELKAIEAKLEQVYARWNELEALTEEGVG
jgi:ATP-binding cassette subfamily F protein uup